MVVLLMYADIQKLKVLGYKKQRATRRLSIDAKTIRKYWDMPEDEYVTYCLETKSYIRFGFLDYMAYFVLRF